MVAEQCGVVVHSQLLQRYACLVENGWHRHALVRGEVTPTLWVGWSCVLVLPPTRVWPLCTLPSLALAHDFTMDAIVDLQLEGCAPFPSLASGGAPPACRGRVCDFLRL